MPLRCSTIELAAHKLVGEDGIEPSPSDFQSAVHTKYTILPLKLVVRAGIAPAVFLMWRVYSPLRSLLR